MSVEADARPILSAVSNSARQIFALLRCISFGTKFLVQPTEDGIRFSVEESSVIEGTAFLSKALFTSFEYSVESTDKDANTVTTEHNNDRSVVPPFAISLPTLLETLQIFGSSEAPKNNVWSRDQFDNDVFSAHALGMTSICRLRYDSYGSPLVVALEEPGLCTTCELVTYEPEFTSDIPFDRTDLAMKIIMGASHLSDAIVELSNSNPDRLTIFATQTSLILFTTGHLGSATVHFQYEPRDKHIGSGKASAATFEQGPLVAKGILETFVVSPSNFKQSYKFAHIANTRKALTSAIKVSIRGDNQGVLSLQLMIDNLEGQGVSFVDYRFVPLIHEDYDEDEGHNQTILET